MMLSAEFVAVFEKLKLLELRQKIRGDMPQELQDRFNLVKRQGIVSRFIWKYLDLDILTFALEFVVVALICERFWVEYEKLTVLHSLTYGLRETIDNLN